MKKHTHTWCQASSSVSTRVKPKNAHSLQIRRGLRLKRANNQEDQGPVRKSQPSQRQEETHYAKTTMPPTVVIQRQEMASFFSLFDDDLIQDFLRMDCCCKMSDKYLLAMTFVYFKRARFTVTEYTRQNLFLALYLANTMEEDEEESKYEIFPWALGKNWRKQFPRFLRQRDKLWARMEYRAAVSRRYCEKVMAIVPSHFVWKRERSEHHSGAQRKYSNQIQAPFPHWPSASPVSCALCHHGSRSDQGPGSTSAQSPDPTFHHPLTSVLSLEITLPRAADSRRMTLEAKIQAQRSSSCSCCTEVPRDESSCRSTTQYDASMDWFDKV
ncbi:speedy protein A [Symphorus nematophorus]